MYVVEVIPIQKIPRSLPQHFSYVSTDPIPRLSLVEVEIRRHTIPALVVAVEPLLQKKATLKDADFSLKPIRRVRSAGPFIPEWYFAYLEDLAHYYLVPISYMCDAALSRLETISAITIPRDEYSPQETPQSSPTPKLLFQESEARFTEYIREIKKNLKHQKGVLVLFPDRDTLERAAALYKKETGVTPVSIHSGVSKKRLAALWKTIFEEKGVVVFATRIGIFFPPRNLGLIIVEEEADPGHKSPETPRYHAREAAHLLRIRTGANMILGSALPTLETLWNTKNDTMTIARPKRSVSFSPTIISLREESGEHPAVRGPLILSQSLKAAISESLAKKLPVILFTYRLGAATTTICRRCSHTFACPRCNVSLITKRVQGTLRFFCHYCGYESSVPDTCPECGSTELSFRGTGSERVETHLKALFPDARIARYDSDTVTTRKDEESLRTAFAKKQIDILIGTQVMLGSADMLEAASLGVILFDTLFHLPDFRSPERAFRIMHTLRRMHKKHSALPFLIQTWQKDPEYLTHLASLSYDEFAEEQYAERKELSYPPFTHLVRLIYKHPKEEEARAVMKKMADMFRLARTKGAFQESSLEIIGPSSAFIPKIRNYYIMTLLLKIKQPLTEGERIIFERIIHPETIVDMDPIEML